MSITDISLLSMLRTKMQWHQERQRLLAENVSNADTPKFRPRDLVPPDIAKDRRSVTAPGDVDLARTEPMHIAASTSGATKFQSSRMGGYDVRPTGNAVNLEDEMMKVASNQMDYQMATSIYSRSLGLLKTAVGKR
ncbi:MAG: flagellar basal body rod protein FlgB [Pseudomonadota bacterium]